MVGLTDLKKPEWNWNWFKTVLVSTQHSKLIFTLIHELISTQEVTQTICCWSSALPTLLLGTCKSYHNNKKFNKNWSHTVSKQKFTKKKKHCLCLGHNFCVRQSCCARGQKRIIHALRNVYILDDLKKFHLFLLYETKRKMLEIIPTMPLKKATKKKKHYLCLGHNFCVRQSCWARDQKGNVRALRIVSILATTLKRSILFLLYDTNRKMLEITPTKPPNKATSLL